MPNPSVESFLAEKKKKNHKLMLLSYYENEKLCTEIYADFSDKTVVIENFVDFFLKKAFGNNNNPSWKDFLNFLEDRCVPRTRCGLREYLEAIGVDEYDPLEIVKKTKGKMAEDYHWLEIKEIK